MCELKMYTAVQVCLQELHRPTFNRDNAKVTIDLIYKMSYEARKAFLGYDSLAKL